MLKKFIVFEGLDGSGKTTQLKLLSKTLDEQEIKHIRVNQPSSSRIGRLTRSAEQGEFPLSTETIAMLFAADRLEIMLNEVRPALESDLYVLCDRHYMSSLAYQGQSDEKYKRVADYNQVSMQNFRPEITIFIDVEPEECIKRITSVRDATGIYEKLSDLLEVRKRYFENFSKLMYTDNVLIIKGDDDINIINKNIYNALCEKGVFYFG